MHWTKNTVGVPFGNSNYDTFLGGSHDMTFVMPLNTPITQIVAGRISDISSPSWGMQVCVEMANGPIDNHPYFAILHLASVNPALRVGQEMSVDDLVGWSGGAVSSSQYTGTSNPTGVDFLNAASMSSQPQVGIALCDGPAYGGKGWKTFPPIDTTLDPMPVVEAYWQKLAEVEPKPDYQRMQWMNTYMAIRQDIDPNSGIANLSWEDYKNGKDRGPAYSKEFTSPDWNGVEKVMQVFATGMYHWYNGSGSWFPFRGD